MKDFLGKALAGSFYLRPLFVVGAMRSGTSVLLQALGKHPVIMAAEGEAPFITTMGGAASLFESAENRQYYNHSMKVPREYLYDGLRRTTFEVAFGRNFGLRTMVKAFLRKEGSPLSVRYWCAKTFPNANVASGLAKLYPGVRFIYIVRNGCDVVHSMTKFAGFSDQEFEKNCRDWARSVENFGYLKDHESAIMVRHEDLVERPDTVFRNIFSFLALEYSERPTSFVQHTIVHPLDKPTQDNVNVKEALHARRPSYEKWSEEQKAAFKGICAEAMGLLGYEIPF